MPRRNITELCRTSPSLATLLVVVFLRYAYTVVEDARLSGGKGMSQGPRSMREAKRQGIPRSHSLGEAAHAPDLLPAADADCLALPMHPVMRLAGAMMCVFA